MVQGTSIQAIADLGCPKFNIYQVITMRRSPQSLVFWIAIAALFLLLPKHFVLGKLQARNFDVQPVSSGDFQTGFQSPAADIGSDSSLVAAVSSSAPFSASDGATAPSSPADSSAQMALAKHLKQAGAVMYSASWCAYCKQQLAMFGESASTLINVVDCDPSGANARPDLCRQAGVRSFPSWEINGQLYDGVRPLDNLADASGYQGSRNWQ
jgi:glutaredoxin